MNPDTPSEPAADLPKPQSAVTATPASYTQNQPEDYLTSQTAGVTVPINAEDSGLIEKAWVQRAKETVMATIDDPYRQHQEVNKLKAEYIKRRYNKIITLGE